MQPKDYMERLKSGLSGYFDFEHDKVLNNVSVDLVAHSLRTNERYLLSKKNTIYRYKNYEHFIFLIREEVTLDQFCSEVEALKDFALSDVDVDEEHMSTDYTIVVHVSEITPDIEAYVNRFQSRKMFMFGLQGRLHTGLVVVSKNKRIVYSKDRRRKHYRFLNIED